MSGLGTRLGVRPGNETGCQALERGWVSGLGTRLGVRPGNEARCQLRSHLKLDIMNETS